MMNLHRVSLVSFALLLAPLLLCVVTFVTADGGSDLLRPKNYRDDVYHCTDPITNNNQGGKNLLLTCDPITYLWNINELKPNKQPDNSELCTELIGILLRSKEKEELQKEAGQLDANINLDVTVRNDIQMWESIMDNSVVDQLEPCVLWAMTYGSLTQYSSSIEINLNNKGKRERRCCVVFLLSFVRLGRQAKTTAYLPACGDGWMDRSIDLSIYLSYGGRIL